MQKNWRKANPDKAKDYALKKDFGITLQDFNKMFEEQAGCCAICSIHQSGLKQSLCVDHCHTTGRVRGLLCKECNLGIGKLKDDVELLVNAINYLKKGEQNG